VAVALAVPIDVPKVLINAVVVALLVTKVVVVPKTVLVLKAVVVASEVPVTLEVPSAVLNEDIKAVVVPILVL